MKKTMLTVLLTISISLSAQGYLAKDACWTYIKGLPSNKSQTFINGDTLLSGKSYKKVFYRLSNLQVNYAGAIREESGKVFANIDTPYLQYGEFLLYDFTLKTGDIIASILNNGSELNESRTVIKIDSITLLNGEKRKKITFDRARPWIEGIGCTSGVFYPAHPLTTDLDEPEIVCFKQNNTPLYKVPEFCPDGNCCDLLSGVPETPADLERRTTLFPNPVKDIATLRFMNQNFPCTSAEMTDVLGKLVKTIALTHSSPYKLDLLEYAAGIYYVLVHFSDKTESYKILKL